MSNALSQLQELVSALKTVIVGQDKLVNRLVVALVTGGHLLLEGPPGLAKTTAVKALAAGVHASFQRIQFTPDLMPADLTGSDVFDPASRQFTFVPGPLFHEIILADEINRSPPKVQAALLEAMEEHQITVGNDTHALGELFLVIATQNPVEQSGTYPLPEAQLDRFQMQVVIDYPNAEEELEILNREIQTAGNLTASVQSSIDKASILELREQLRLIHCEQSVRRYLVELVNKTRNLQVLNPQWKHYLVAGASPRASKALLWCGAAIAMLEQRDYITPDDIVEVFSDVIRHRLVLSYEATANGVGSQEIIQAIIDNTQSP